MESVRLDGGDEVVAEVDDLQSARAGQPVRRNRLDAIATEVDRLERLDSAKVDGRRQPVLLRVQPPQSPQRPHVVQPLQTTAFNHNTLPPYLSVHTQETTISKQQ